MKHRPRKSVNRQLISACKCPRRYQLVSLSKRQLLFFFHRRRRRRRRRLQGHRSWASPGVKGTAMRISGRNPTPHPPPPQTPLLPSPFPNQLQRPNNHRRRRAVTTNPRNHRAMLSLPTPLIQSPNPPSSILTPRSPLTPLPGLRPRRPPTTTITTSPATTRGLLI